MGHFAKDSGVLVPGVTDDGAVPRVVAKAGTALQQRVLQKVEAEVVVFPEEDAGYRVAHTLAYPAIHDFIDRGEDYLILEVEVRRAWVGKTLAELGLAGQGSAAPRRQALPERPGSGIRAAGSLPTYRSRHKRWLVISYRAV